MRCKIDDCGKDARTRGWCPRHYTRWKRHGDPLVVRPRSDRGDGVCTEPGCGREYHAKGLCQMHYQRGRLHRDVIYQVSWADAARFSLTEEGKRMVDMFRDGEVA